VVAARYERPNEVDGCGVDSGRVVGVAGECGSKK
jgi:hypothetical protein